MPRPKTLFCVFNWNLSSRENESVFWGCGGHSYLSKNKLHKLCLRQELGFPMVHPNYHQMHCLSWGLNLTYLVFYHCDQNNWARKGLFPLTVPHHRPSSKEGGCFYLDSDQATGCQASISLHDPFNPWAPTATVQTGTKGRNWSRDTIVGAWGETSCLLSWSSWLAPHGFLTQPRSTFPGSTAHTNH